MIFGALEVQQGAKIITNLWDVEFLSLLLCHLSSWFASLRFRSSCWLCLPQLSLASRRKSPRLQLDRGDGTEPSNVSSARLSVPRAVLSRLLESCSFHSSLRFYHLSRLSLELGNVNQSKWLQVAPAWLWVWVWVACIRLGAFDGPTWRLRSSNWRVDSWAAILMISAHVSYWNQWFSFLLVVFNVFEDRTYEAR